MICPYCHRETEGEDVCRKCYAMLPKSKKEIDPKKEEKKEVKEDK